MHTRLSHRFLRALVISSVAVCSWTTDLVWARSCVRGGATIAILAEFGFYLGWTEAAVRQHLGSPGAVTAHAESDSGRHLAYTFRESRLLLVLTGGRVRALHLIARTDRASAYGEAVAHLSAVLGASSALTPHRLGWDTAAVNAELAGWDREFNLTVLRK